MYSTQYSAFQTVVREKFGIHLFFQELKFINVSCTIKIVNVLKCKENHL